MNSTSTRIIGHGVKVTSIQPRGTGGGGVWVSGYVAGYRFNALVFPEHATVRSYELARSRISKLGVIRLRDGEIVYEWDRGLTRGPPLILKPPPRSDGYRNTWQTLYSTLE